EGRAWKLARQALPEPPHVIAGRTVARPERYEDIRVGGPDHTGGRVHVVDDAVRQPDVVEDAGALGIGNLLADHVLDQVGESGGLRDARAGLGAQMQDEMAAVAIRKEILAEPWHEHTGVETQQDLDRYEDHTHCDEALEHFPVSAPPCLEHAREPALEHRE